MSLSELKKAIREKIEEFEVVGEIRLKSASYEKLKGELEQTSGTCICELQSLWGIPIIVDDGIPSDRMWILKKKEREEVIS